MLSVTASSLTLWSGSLSYVQAFRLKTQGPSLYGLQTPRSPEVKWSTPCEDVSQALAPPTKGNVMKLIIITTLFFILTSCATQSAANLDKLYVGVGKGYVDSNIGKPQLFIGSFQTKQHRNAEVWQYNVRAPISKTAATKASDALFAIFTLGMSISAEEGSTPRYMYYFYYIDGKLIRYGNPSNYEADRKYTYEQ